MVETSSAMVQSAALDGAIRLPLAWQFMSPGPIFLKLGPLTIRWYGLLIAIALMAGVSLSQWLAPRRKLDRDAIADASIWLVLGALPAARIYYVLFNWPAYAGHPDRMIAIWEGGIAIHGAILGGLLALATFARINRISLWQLIDTIAPSLILGQAIGRWGNFFNSEAFGRPTDLPWKLFIPPDRRPLGYEGFEYFHPTFLYESLWNLGVFGLLITLFLRKPNLKPGTIGCLYAIAYSLGRVWIEGLRTDSLMLGPLRMAQMVSLTGVAIGTLGLFWLYGRRRSLPDVVSPSREAPNGSD